MKKLSLLVVGLVLFGSACVADNQKFVVIDRTVLMQKSQEGEKLTKELKKEFESLQTEYQEYQKELADQQAAIDKQAQAKVLSKDALTEKKDELEKKKQEFQFKLSNKEEALRRKLQTKQHAFLEKVEDVIKGIFEKENWELLVDKNTPGVICKTDNDKTAMILKAVDAQYVAEKSASKTTKTAKNSTGVTPKAA